MKITKKMRNQWTRKVSVVALGALALGMCVPALPVLANEGVTIAPVATAEATMPTLPTRISLTINQHAIDLVNAPLVVDDTVLIPVREVLETLDYMVEWVEECKKIWVMKSTEHYSHYVSIMTASNHLEILFVGESVVGNRAKCLLLPNNEKAPVQVINGCTYAPLSILEDGFGYTVTWDELTQSIHIQSDDTPIVYPPSDESWLAEVAIFCDSMEFPPYTRPDIDYCTKEYREWLERAQNDTEVVVPPIELFDFEGVNLDAIAPSTSDAPTINIAPMNKDENTLSPDEYALEVVRLVNIERVKVGLNELAVLPELMEAAQIRANDLLTLFSHQRPDGTWTTSGLKDIQRTVAWGAENIGKGQMTPEVVMRDWMASEGHKKAILSQNYAYIGVGYIDDAWVQVFGFPKYE